MIEPSELDLAQLRHDMRQLYHHIGYEESLQVLYEMMKGSEVFAEIILQEHAKERGTSL